MSNLLPTVNENLLSCVASCPVECEITTFSGSVSFSQLSNQATTSKLVGSQADAIEADYANALELHYRLNYNNPFLDQLMALSHLTQSSIDQLKDSLNLLSKISSGLDLFDNGVGRDMVNLNNVLCNFQLFYNNTFKASRFQAGKYITESFNCLQNLDFVLRLQPFSFTNFSVAYWAYIKLNSLLSDCIVNTDLAVTYLTEAIDFESRTGMPFGPDKFYKSPPYGYIERYSYYDFACRHSYEVVFGALNGFAPILNLASQKVSFWLQTNTANIERTTMRSVQPGSSKLAMNYFTTPSIQSIITDEKFSNLFDASTSNDVHSTELFHAITEGSNEYFSGFWTLLDCESCAQPLNKTWNDLIASLTSNACYTAASQCFVAYESSLFDAIASSLLSIASTPTFSTSDRLKTSLLSMSAQATYLEENIHSYKLSVQSVERICQRWQGIF